MPATPIYLFKAARRPLYRKENLHLLAEERGAVVEVAELTPYYDEREDEGWRRAVDGVLEMSSHSSDDPYRRSVFFRPAGVRTPDGEVHRARRVELEPGAEARLRLRFHNPHLPADDVGALTLRVVAEDSLRVQAPERFRWTPEAQKQLSGTAHEASYLNDCSA